MVGWDFENVLIEMFYIFISVSSQDSRATGPQKDQSIAIVGGRQRERGDLFHKRAAWEAHYQSKVQSNDDVGVIGLLEQQCLVRLIQGRQRGRADNNNGDLVRHQWQISARLRELAAANKRARNANTGANEAEQRAGGRVAGGSQDSHRRVRGAACKRFHHNQGAARSAHTNAEFAAREHERLPRRQI